jgi:flavoprotein
MKIAWCITGGGQFLKECVDLMLELKEVDLFLSRAGEEVVQMYRLADPIQRLTVFRERDSAASSTVWGFAKPKYSALVVAPATSNSVAKFVWGISDSLVTNLFAQGGKHRVPIAVLPTDVASEMVSKTPSGKEVKVYPRPVDLENTARLAKFPGVKVVKSVEELRGWLLTSLGMGGGES